VISEFETKEKNEKVKFVDSKEIIELFDNFSY